jgi:hypothetical protein
MGLVVVRPLPKFGWVEGPVLGQEIPLAGWLALVPRLN